MTKLYITVILLFIFSCANAYYTVKTKTDKNSLINPQVFDLGLVANFSLFTTAGAMGNTGVSTISGDIGTNLGITSGFELSTVSGSFYNADHITNQAASDLASLYNQLIGTTNTATHGAVYGGETLLPGVYSLPSAGSIGGTLILDGGGDPSAMFIIKMGGALTAGAGSTMQLINSASATNVYWVIEGAISIGAAATLTGTFLAHNAAAGMGANSTLNGRLLSTSGAISINNNIIMLPLPAFTWIGATSNNWNTATNWLNNTIPGINDDAYIGVSIPFQNFPTILMGAGSTNVGSVKLGSTGGQASGILINAGSTLNVKNFITFQSDINSTSEYTSTLSGEGTINTQYLNIIANTNLNGNSYVTKLSSSIKLLNVSSNISLTSVAISSDRYNAVFILTGGTIALAGNIQTLNTDASNSNFSIIPTINNIAILKLVNSSPLISLSIKGNNIINFNTKGATVDYAGNAQSIYNNVTIPGLTGGIDYMNIKFSGTGLVTLPAGNLNISGDFENAMLNDASNNLNLTNNTVNFNGGVQTLIGGLGSGTVFSRLNFSGEGTKYMKSGNFSLNSIGVLTLLGNSLNTILDANGNLTVNSDAISSATIAAIPNGPSITGNVNVQRFFNAQVSGSTADNTRGYRILSSPVNNGTENYSLKYLNSVSSTLSGVYVFSPTGNSGGFTSTNATPSLYLYNESVAISNESFSGGNFKGITNISGNDVLYDSGNGVSTMTSIPKGNGFFLYYMGNNITNITSTNSLNKQFRFSGAYIAPDASTTTAIGKLNQGSINVKLWWNGSTNLSSVNSGFNLVGNPYASTIDWDQYSATNNAAGIYAPGISPIIYVFNFSNKNYGIYASGTLQEASTNNASRYIASGQGFFVKANAPNGASITFNETAKTTIQPNSLGKPKLLMSLPAPSPINQMLKVKLSKDAINTDETVLLFASNSKNEFEPDFDIERLNGIGNVVSLASTGTNNKTLLAINRMQSINLNTRVKLYVKIDNSTAKDTLSFSGFDSIDKRFEPFLIDHFKNDSIMISSIPNYLFSINNADTTSFGLNRFEIVFNKKANLNYKLISFDAREEKTGVLLTWKTTNENNYTEFEIEKKTGANEFIPLKLIQSSGNGSYSYLDTDPIIGLNSYRLKQKDIFEETSYSKIASILKSEANNSGRVTLFPNPARNQATLNINYNIPSRVNVKISNMIGQILVDKNAEGANINLDLKKLIPGNYVVTICDVDTNLIVGVKKLIIN